jgi:hypothetical protein
LPSLDLIAEAGFTVCLDFEADMRPHPLQTASGTIAGLPHYNELSDMTLMVTRSQSEAEWHDQLVAAAQDHILRAGDEGAGAFGVTVTPYVTGQPFRIGTFSDLLHTLKATEGLEIVTAAEAVARFAEASS